MNNAFAIVYAKQGNRLLDDLVELRSIGALPIGGRYRVIDVLLSNLTNSGVRSVGIITQRNYKSLIDHIGSGKEWNLSKKVGGLMLLPPYDLGTGRDLYHGLPDALLSKRDFIEHQRWKYCLLIATDKIYREDYNAMMNQHIESEADITVLYSRDPRLMTDDTGSTSYFKIEDGNIVDVVASPSIGGEVVSNMGACLMTKELLMTLVDDTCAAGRYNFDYDLLARAVKEYKVMGVEHEGYVGTISSVKSYYDVNMDMLDPDVRYDLFDPEFPVYTKVLDAPPSRFMTHSEIDNSLFGTGCRIDGRVKDSVIFRGVHIEEGADVEGCIIMQNSVVESGAKLRNMILDKNVRIKSNVKCVSVPYAPGIVRKGAVIEGNE